MGTGVDNLAYFRINITEIKKLGKQWGLSEDEIDTCIDRAIAQDLGDLVKKNKAHHIVGQCLSGIRILTKFVFYFFLAIFAFAFFIYVLTTVSEPTGDRIEKSLAPYTYDFFRVIRLAALPLHKRFQFSEYYDAECIIENPYFVKPPVECAVCTYIKSVKEIPANSTHVGLGRIDRPRVYRNRSEYNVTFEDLVKMYERQPAVFDSNVYAFKSTDVSIRNLRDLFHDDMFGKIKNSKGFHVEVQTKRLGTAYALRQLYRRPKFIRNQSEVSLEKTLVVDGPESPHTRLEVGFFDGTWLVQSHASRMVFLNVPHNCVKECLSLKVTLNPGDILFYDNTLWTADLLPTTDASITFKGHFSLQF